MHVAIYIPCVCFFNNHIIFNINLRTSNLRPAAATKTQQPAPLIPHFLVNLVCWNRIHFYICWNRTNLNFNHKIYCRLLTSNNHLRLMNEIPQTICLNRLVQRHYCCQNHKYCSEPEWYCFRSRRSKAFTIFSFLRNFLV